METDTIKRPAPSGYAPINELKVPGWHGLVVWDMLLNNLSTGLFLVTAVAELTAPQTFTPLAVVAYPLALVLLLADLVLLVLDLGDPWRFHHMLRVFKLSSPMSLGVWSLTAYSLPLTVAAGLGLLPASNPTVETIRRVAVILGLLPALASALYKGVLFSTSSQVGWKDARWLGGYLTSAALVLGAAELLVLSALGGPAEATHLLRVALAALLVVHAVPAALLLAEVYRATAELPSAGQWMRTGAAALGGSILLPLVVLLLWGGIGGVGLAGVAIFVGSLMARTEIVRLAQLR